MGEPDPDEPVGVVATSFRLDKWYFDCVSPDGTVLIGYAARLRWGPVGLGYGARITKATDGPLFQKQTLSFGQVAEEPGGISWRNDALNVIGRWTGGRAIDRTVLLDGADGGVAWQCLGADCDVSVRVDGEAMEGSGYAERLVMTVPPWRLPFKELRWGRFIAEDGRDHAVWIDMRGKLRRNWTWLNGNAAVDGTVDDTGVRAGGHELLFETSRPIRDEDVARTLLGRFRLLARLLPEEARVVQEDKQLSSCVLRSEGSESRGWSINEVVRWR